MKYSSAKVAEFLKESNAIENEFSADALLDSMLAWKYINIVSELTLDEVRACHGITMKNINPRIAGKFRTCEVSVGGRQGAPMRRLEYLLTEWVKDANIVKTDKEIKKNHICFEKIHPFEDGNGRTGRLIMLWQRQKADLSMEIIYVKERAQYYTWFA